jgi:hypothetical protein
MMTQLAMGFLAILEPFFETRFVYVANAPAAFAGIIKWLFVGSRIPTHSTNIFVQDGHTISGVAAEPAKRKHP